MSGSSAPSSPPLEVPSPANPITYSQVEVLLSRAASIMGLLIGLQALPALLAQFTVMDTAVGLTVLVVVFGSLALAGLAAIFRQWTSSTFAWFAVIYLVVVLFWPVVVPGPLPGGDATWIYYLCNVGTGFAVVAARRRWWLAAAYTVVTPTVIGWLRTLPEGGGASFSQALLDGLYCFYLGAVILVVSVALRQAAAAVDRAQATALESYAEAVRQNATETERVQIDALVHDSVLTTLLSAARARTPESQALAARMARNAMGHLASARSSFPSPPTDVPLSVVAGRLRLAVAEQPVIFDIHMRNVGSGSVPDAAAEALVSAATQAMVNSVNHAGGAEVARSLHVTGVPGGVTVTVQDDGRGFDPAAIPVERLGVRTSILDRMATVGGSADVVSRPGAGTRIELAWGSPEAPVPEPVLGTAGWAE